MLTKLFLLAILVIIIFYFSMPTINYNNLAPISGSEPYYLPYIWNIPPIIKTHNCYNYAFNGWHPSQTKKAQPGIGNDSERYNYSCDNTTLKLLNEQKYIIPSDFDSKCPADYRKISLHAVPTGVNDNNGDYHFVRQDSIGLWSHNP